MVIGLKKYGPDLITHKRYKAFYLTVYFCDPGISIGEIDLSGVYAFLRYEIELSDPAQLERVLSDMRVVDGVYESYRLVPGGGQ